jgi:hypothetical protein
MSAMSAVSGGEHSGHSGALTGAPGAGPRPGPGPAGAPPRARRAGGVARVAGLVLAAVAAVAAACAPPADRTAGRGPVLYVANGPDGTVTRLEGATGRVAGPPLPAGPTPRDLTAGAGGRLLVTSVGAEHQGTLTHVGPERGAWTARTVALEPGARVAHLTGDGDTTGAAVYVVAPGAPGAPAAPAAPAAPDRPTRPPCRLVVVDLRDGAAGPPHPLCAPGEAITGLALEAGPAGPVVYAALWAEHPAGAADAGPRARLVALDVARGTVVATLPLEGVPGPLLVGPAPGRIGRRLYSVSTDGVPEARHDEDVGQRFAAAGAWRLTGLNPTTLDVESVQRLPHAVSRPVLAPDGDRLYAVVGPPSPTGGVRLIDVDLVAASARLFGPAPGSGLGAVAVAGDRLYVPDAMGDAVWVLDRRRGHVVGRASAGRRPLGVTVEARSAG